MLLPKRRYRPKNAIRLWGDTIVFGDDDCTSRTHTHRGGTGTQYRNAQASHQSSVTTIQLQLYINNTITGYSWMSFPLRIGFPF